MAFSDRSLRCTVHNNLEIRSVNLALGGILCYPCSASRGEFYSLPTDPILGHGGQTMRSLTSKTKETCGTTPRTPAAPIIWPASPTNSKSPTRATAFMWRSTSGSSNAANWITSARASSGRLSLTKTAPRSCASSMSTTRFAAASTATLLPSIARCCLRGLTWGCHRSIIRSEGGCGQFGNSATGEPLKSIVNVSGDSSNS